MTNTEEKQLNEVTDKMTQEFYMLIFEMSREEKEKLLKYIKENIIS